MLNEVSGVRAGDDIECVHRMRVASRRLRAALKLFPDCLPSRLHRHMRHLARSAAVALGPTRDTDVQIAYLSATMAQLVEPHLIPGVSRLHLRLRQHRAALQQDVVSMLERLETDHAAPKAVAYLSAHAHPLLTPSPALLAHAASAIHARLSAVLTREGPALQTASIAELHTLRIAMKRLRYTMEPFVVLRPTELQEPVNAAKKLQQILGEIHDCDVWSALLTRFLDDERRRTEDYFGHDRPFSPLVAGVHYLSQQRAAHREAQHRELLTQWAACRAVWNALRAVLAQWR